MNDGEGLCDDGGDECGSPCSASAVVSWQWL